MDRFRQFGGGALVLGSLSLYSGIVVRSDHSQVEMAEQFADVEAARTPELVAAALFVLGAILFVPAGLALARMAAERGARLMTAGATLLVLGGMWFATGRAMTAHLLYAATGTDVPRDEILPSFVAISESPSFAIFLPFLLSFLIGPAVLGAGLWKASLAPWAIIPAWFVSLGSFMAVEGSAVGEAVGFGLMTAVLCWMGVILLRGQAFPARGRTDAISAMPVASN